MDLISIISKWLEEEHPKYAIVSRDFLRSSGMGSAYADNRSCGILIKKDSYHNWWTGDIYHDHIRIGVTIGVGFGACFEYLTIHAYDPKFFKKLEKHLS